MGRLTRYFSLILPESHRRGGTNPPPVDVEIRCNGTELLRAAGFSLGLNYRKLKNFFY